MELNNYGFNGHGHGHSHTQGHSRNEIRSRSDGGSGLQTIATHASLERKEGDEFIDHTLLAPEYIRDSNNFIIDFIEHPAVFSKNVVQAVTAGATAVTTNGFAVKDALASELHFPNSIFQFVNKQGQLHVADAAIDNVGEATESALRTLTVATAPPTGLALPAVSSDGTAAFMTLTATDFLTTAGQATKTFCNADNEAAETVVPVVETVPQFPALTLLSESNVALDDADVIAEDDMTCAPSNARKVLPHKKRISRKLKVVQRGEDAEVALPAELESQKDDRLPTGTMQFNCEICCYTTSSQLDFFAHLKEHYEPTTILASMKTTLDTCMSPTKAVDNICSLTKKTDDSNVSHVFHDVHLNFEDFNNVDDIKILNANSIGKCISSYNSQVNSAPLKVVSDEVEFSDTEDMLEGIRNVVDKVSIEDTCDDIDLMGSSSERAPWFANSFSGIDFKSKPFSDVSFSEPLSQILDNDSTTVSVPAGDDCGTLKLSEPFSLVSYPTNRAVKKHHNDEEGEEDGANNEHGSMYRPGTCDMQHEEEDDEEFVIIKNEDIEDEEEDDERASPIGVGGGEDPEEFQRINELNGDYVDTGGGNRTKVMHESDGKSVRDYSSSDDQVTRTKKRYFCNKCNREFNSCNALKYHHRTHSGIRPHQCDVCGKSFYALSALKSHIRTHTGDKPFECEQCAHRFRQWGDLKYHIISKHTEEKSHQCEFCGKAFSRKYSLVLHRRIHTSERNYKCEFCDKSFRASTYLQNHRKIHTGEKPYECDVCNKRFRVSGDLRRHHRIHQRKTDT